MGVEGTKRNLFQEEKKNKNGLYLKGQLRVLVQILHHRLRQLRVLSQFLGVHPQAHDPRRLVSLGVVRDPARAEVEQRGVGAAARREDLGVELRQRGDGRVVDVRDEARGVVEERVVGLVVARKVLPREGGLGGPLDAHEGLKEFERESFKKRRKKKRSSDTTV